MTDARDLWLAYAFKGLFEGALAGMEMCMFIVCGCRQSGLRDEFFTWFFCALVVTRKGSQYPACLSKHLLYMRFFISDRKSGKQKLRVDTKTTKTNKESKCQSNKKMAQRMSGTGSNGKADVT